MSAQIIQAPADRLRYLRELQARKDALEAERLSSLDVFPLIGYEPTCMPVHDARRAIARGEDVIVPGPCGQCPQELFHSATEDAVLYGGASGGGKSHAITAEGIRAAVRYPGLRVLLIRRTYDELEESIFPVLRKFRFGESVGGHWNGSSRELSFTNGSIFRFRYMESADDASRRQGGEYQLLLVDELALMAPGVVDILQFERLRASGGLPVIGLRATSNPGGPGHGEVKERYIEATEDGRRVVTDDHGLTVRFIQAKATDNPHLDAGHKARLDAIPDPARRAAMRDGDWNQFDGMMFKEYRAGRHVMDPVTLPVSWQRYNGIDWGFASPWAVLWGAVDPDKRLWVYREIYQSHVKESDQAKMILAAEADGEDVAVRWADDSMWDLEGDALPKSQMYAENGVYIEKAGKGQGSRVTGWQRIHSYMAEMPACPHHRAQGWDSCPGIHIFQTCPKLIGELKNLPYARTGNPEDADPKAKDHAMDALRYLTVNLGSGPSFPIMGDLPGPQHAGQLQGFGQFAVRPPDDGLPFALAADEEPRASVRRSPWA